VMMKISLQENKQWTYRHMMLLEKWQWISMQWGRKTSDQNANSLKSWIKNSNS